MRKWLAIVSGCLILLIVNVMIYQKEQLRSNGETVLLALAPVDPRSLMQGDYMALDFAISRNIFRRETSGTDGHIVLRRDENNVGEFVRFDEGEPLEAGEIRMRYRLNGTRVEFATNAYFFQEGHAADFQAARYGEFSVDKQGNALLTGLRDDAFRVLETQPKSPDE